MTATLPPPLAKRWIFPDAPDEAAVSLLCRELGLPPVICRLLVGRGHVEPTRAKQFLRPGVAQLHDARRMAGMSDAVARLRRAIHARETILVHGDYDVDGICSTALYVRALGMLGVRAVPFVPHRLADGYDLSDAGIAAARDAGATLILTGDCGIVAHDAVDRARRAGIDVVVTDHHTPGATLPAAVAVVNPNRRDCPYPDKDLAGVGVAYKVCVALAGEMGVPEDRLHRFLDLVAIATVADLAPLRGENRVLVRWGLKMLPASPNPGVRALLRATGLEGRAEINASQVGFILAPRINAVGRMGEALRGVRLLLTDDAAEADKIAAVLEAENRWRRSVEGDTLREAMADVERSFEPERDRGVVLASARWHPGVIGIVASRVVERIHRPTVMIALTSTDEGKGSARSIPGFHLYDAMRGCAGLLTRFGGHRYAAGCSIHPGNVDAFRAAFDARARAALVEDDLVPRVRIDLDVALPDANAELHRLLRHVGPYGAENATPVFAARGVSLAGSPRVVGTDHLKIVLRSGDATLEAIGFGMAERAAEPGFGAGPLDVAFRLEENTWNGRTSLQARLVDVRAAE